MAKVYVFMANGFEDVEALIPIDVLRRGGVDVITVSTTEDRRSHRRVSAWCGHPSRHDVYCL